MVRKNRILLYILLVLLPLAIPSCKSEPVRVSVVEKGDYSVLLEAVRSSEQSLAAKLALLEKAVLDGVADDTQALQLIQEMIQSLNGSMAEKLSALEQAMKAQTAGLEGKLALLDAAVQQGITDTQAQQTLLQQALTSLSGTLEQKFSAIESAVQAQNTSLDTKLGLIETAVQEGFVAKSGKDKLLLEALESLSGSAAEKLSAIETLMNSELSGLTTKIGILVQALENGFGNNETIVKNLIKALNTHLGELTPDLAALQTDVVNKLTEISGQLAPSEFSKAFKGVMDALDGENKGAGEILKALKTAVEELQAKVGNSMLKELVYMGHPTEPVTVSCGQDLELKLMVNPSKVRLTQEMLSMERVSSHQFFLPGTDKNQATKNHYPSFTLQADPEMEGQYIVKVKTLVDQTYKYWDESSLVFKALIKDKEGNSQYISTTPIPVAIMPNPKDGLILSGLEKTATFRISADTLGVIYQPLVSVSFTDGAQTRTYTSAFLKSAEFQSASLAANAQLERERHFVAICPDIQDAGWQALKDSTYVHYKEINGALTLTDRWGGSTSTTLSALRWYTHYDEASFIASIAADGAMDVDLTSMAASLGLNLGATPGDTYCSVRFDFASASGAWRSAQFKDYSWTLKMQVVTPVASGARFTVDAVVRQTVQPDQDDSSFRPTQRKARIRIDLTAK